jgi:hypothetical protein
MSAGNTPAAERLARQTIRLTGADFPRVAGGALVQLAIIRSVRGDYNGALAYAWRAFTLADTSAHGRQTALANIAQILLDAGYPAAARVASSHALRQPKLRTPVFAHLSTYAAASAALSDGKAVDWVAGELLRLANPPFFAQYAADALLDCSFSLEQVGRTRKAKQLRARAHAIATRHGYHDIAWMAEHDLRRGKPRAPSRITRATEAIVSEIRALEPADLSLRVHAG